MGSGHGTVKKNTAEHPNRKVHGERFSVGDTVEHPELGPLQVHSITQRRSGEVFSARFPSGERYGTTATGLTMGHKMGSDPDPWPVHTETGIEEDARLGKGVPKGFRINEAGTGYTDIPPGGDSGMTISPESESEQYKRQVRDKASRYTGRPNY